MYFLNIADSTGLVQELSSDNTDAIWMISIFIAIAVAIVHMLITFRLKRYKPVSIEEITALRRAKNKEEESTEEEDELAMEYLNDLFDHWTTVSASDDDVSKAPTKKAHLNSSLKELEKIKEIGSTHPDVIERMNEMGDVVNYNSKRSFSGSKALIIVSILATIGFYYITKSENETVLENILDLWWFWGSNIFYIVASFAPQFLIDKRLRNLGSSNFSSGLVGFFAGLFFAAPTFTTVTKYTDGSSSTTTDFNFLGLLLMVLGLFIIAMFMIVFGLLNYLRNYVIFI
jgi:hypothetical protein